MNLYLDCMPCFLKQSLEMARSVTEDTKIHEQIVRYVLDLMAELDYALPPPRVAQLIHRRLRELTGVEDPYQAAKRQFNHLALELLPDLKSHIEQNSQPMIEAAKLAIAANIIDLGAKSSLTVEQASAALRSSCDISIFGDLKEFQERVAQASDILYLADNTGEIVIDRLLIEELGSQRVTLAVRGGPILNDATIADAHEAGIHELVEVIDNGSDAPGTYLDDCSIPFQKRFRKANLIIAKGQGNFETLSEVDADIFFLLMVKCPVIGEHIGLPTGTHALLYSRNLNLNHARQQDEKASAAQHPMAPKKTSPMTTP